MDTRYGYIKIQHSMLKANMWLVRFGEVPLAVNIYMGKVMEKSSALSSHFVYSRSNQKSIIVVC